MTDYNNDTDTLDDVLKELHIHMAAHPSESETINIITTYVHKAYQIGIRDGIDKMASAALKRLAIINTEENDN